MWSIRLGFRPLSAMNARKYQSIAECYEGQSVFMTGGTGFLGKVLLEKLVYCCTGIDKIYLLVRETPGATAEQRVQKILEQPLFSRVKKENPEALAKIVPVAGNISQPRLGLNAEDEALLADKVSFVFHVAANVKFNEPLEDAMNVNVAGTGRTLNLCKRIKNLKAFVYVSTAYSNTDRKVIDEVVYPAPASVDEVKTVVGNNISNQKLKKLLNGKPNTYTFTKAIAENMVAANHGKVPAIIIRPSAVSSIKNEPLVGWIDNLFGASELSVTIMKGWNRVILARPDNYIDLIPVDYVWNLIIVAAARCKWSKNVNVYNICTSGENPITMKQYLYQAIVDSRTHKFNDVPMPMIFFINSKQLLKLLTLLFQTVPAYVADIFLLITGKKTKHVKNQARAVKVRDNVEYFISNNWVISAFGTRELAKSLSPTDRHLFPCDPADIDWKEYIPIYCQGIRQFCKT